MAWCGGLRADHGQKHDPGDEIIIQRDLTNIGPLQKAIDWFTANSFLAADVIRSEVDRYIDLPAQALSYKIGEIAIRRLRAYAEAELGDAFVLRDFHDELLGLGPVSLSALDRHMTKWVRSSQV
ncbi:hypothetical protein BH09PSE3_BH09PSE3_23570 [soil metagenome]